MNRAITGAWGTGASGSSSNGSASGPSGSSRRNKISLNSPLPGRAANGQTNPEASSLTGSSTPPVPGQVWMQPEVLPAGSAAAAAAARKQQEEDKDVESSRNGGRAGEEAGEGSVERGSLSKLEQPQEEDGEGESLHMSIAKRKARILSQTSGAQSPGAKRRKPVTNGKGTGQTFSSKSTNIVTPTTRLKDLGGVTSALDKVLELIAMPLCHPEIYYHTGVKPPRGVLLHGPPGCGKTMLAGALAGELNVPLINISSPSIVSGTSGESEQTLRKLFDEAISIAPCIIFLDEIDAITPKRETASREMERRIVAQLLTLLDDLTWDKTDGKPVMVVGATNRPDALDPALRRAGRFDHEIALGVPDEAGREEILRILCTGLRLSGDFDLRMLAKQTPGYVGADLVALTAAAGIRAVKRIFAELAANGQDIEMAESIAEQITDVSGASTVLTEGSVPNGQTTPLGALDEPTEEQAHAMPSSTLFEALPESLRSSAIATFLRSHPSPLTASQLSRLQITPEDFLASLPSIQPSSKREGFATVPDVTWSDIGSLEATREELEMSIVEPIKHPELFQAIGVAQSGGVLLWGPPGCGKTLLAKAVANESGANFISVKGPELLNKYVGESERAVRQVFARARTSSPCVIFFDELDALVPRRDDSLTESSSRVVNTLLTELDGLEARVQTYVVGATNRPDMIDPAMCRPGRLDKLLYVDLPNAVERIKILRTVTQKTPLERIVTAPLSGSERPLANEDEDELESERRKAEQDGLQWLCAIATDVRCDGFSGADLAALVREASVLALRQELHSRRRTTLESEPRPMPSNQAASASKASASFSMGAPTAKISVVVKAAHFDAALDKVQPSVGQAQRKKYAALRSRLSGTPSAANEGAASSARRDLSDRRGEVGGSASG